MITLNKLNVYFLTGIILGMFAMAMNYTFSYITYFIVTSIVCIGTYLLLNKAYERKENDI